MHALLDSFLHILLCGVEFLLEKLYLPREALVSRTRLLPLGLCSLELLKLAVGLVEIGVRDSELVLERSDLLLFLKQQLFELLVLCLGAFSTIDCAIRFRPKGSEFLSTRK